MLDSCSLNLNQIMQDFKIDSLKLFFLYIHTSFQNQIANIFIRINTS